jgi:hypothetical protein
VCEAYQRGKAVYALRLAAGRNGRAGLPNIRHKHAKFCAVCVAYNEAKAA